MKLENSSPQTDDTLLVDISDALSERDRVRFTVHTRTKLPQFAKPVLSVVRQHEEFIWLHDCLCENDQYAGYIIPPPPPKPDFDASRDKLQRLGDCEASLTKDEFAKMKQELEAEYLAIFKKTVAMHEIFLQRLAVHNKFREDSNFKIFLEYENELAVRGKSKREKLAGSIQNLGKSLTDFVITTSQVANSNSIGNIASSVSSNSISGNNFTNTLAQINRPVYDANLNNPHQSISSTAAGAEGPGNNNNNNNLICNDVSSTSASGGNGSSTDTYDAADEQYFDKERLFLALYHNSIRETAICADRVTQAHKCVADSYLHIAQQLVKLASIEVVPITSRTVDLSNSVASPLPSLTLPAPARSDSINPANTAQATASNSIGLPSSSSSSTSSMSPPSTVNTVEKRLELMNDDRRGLDEDDGNENGQRLANNEQNHSSSGTGNINSSLHISNVNNDNKKSDSTIGNTNNKYISTRGCASDHTSEGLKKLLLNVSEYLEQARKIESRVASDEDLKLTDTFLYYKRDTVAAQDLLARRVRFLSEYENATKNLERARLKGSTTAMQYADVIQKQAKENFLSISKLAKQELIGYKKRRVASFRKAFTDIAELEVKHLKSQSHLIVNCLNLCRGLAPHEPVASTSNRQQQKQSSK